MARTFILILVAVAGCTDLPASPNVDAEEVGVTITIPSAAELKWRALAPGPAPHAENVAVLLDGRIYSIGGFDSTNHIDGVALAVPLPGAGSSATVDIFDIASGTWLPGPDYPVALDHQAGAASNGAVYVFLGPDSYRLPGPEAEWTPFSPPPFRPATAGVDPETGLIYLAEWGSGESARGFARYDPMADSYETLADYPVGRNHVASAFVAGKFYLSVGDLSGHAINTARTDIYDPSADTWTSGEPNPFVRGSAAGTEWLGRFVVLGGQNQTTGVRAVDEAAGVGLRTGPPSFPDAHMYDPTTDAWTRLPDMPTGRHGFSAVTHEGQIYAVAGAPQQGFSGFSELDVLSTIKTP